MSDTVNASAEQDAEKSVPQAEGSELRDDQLESVAGGRRPQPYPDDPIILPIYPIDPPVIVLPYEPVIALDSTDTSTTA